MKRREFVLIGTMLTAILFGSSGAISPAHADDAKVNIDNFTFSPAQITVTPGTKVTWENRDDIPHTVTDAGSPRTFKSPPLDTGDYLLLRVFGTRDISLFLLHASPYAGDGGGEVSISLLEASSRRVIALGPPERPSRIHRCCVT